MYCLLLWFTANLFLYKCPNGVSPPMDKNCTNVHSGTYDQEYVLMCTELIYLPTTTRLATTTQRIATTTPMVTTPLAHTSTELLSSTAHAATTPRIYSTTTMSSNHSHTTTNSLYRPTTTKLPNHIQLTTGHPISNQTTFNASHPSYIDNNTPNSVVIIQESSHILIIALVTSSVSFIGCIALGIWSFHQHQLHKRNKVVRPDDIELSSIETIEKEEQEDVDVEQQKQRVEQLKRMENGSITSRKATPKKTMIKRTPSQVKKMTLDDWKQFRDTITHPTVVKTPPVDRTRKFGQKKIASDTSISKPVSKLANVANVVKRNNKPVNRKEHVPPLDHRQLHVNRNAMPPPPPSQKPSRSLVQKMVTKLNNHNNN
jgi:hypothetical protein